MAGATVVRGPDWKWGSQDGGEGGTGTVVKLIRNSTEINLKKYSKTAIVKWKDGSSNIYRVGAENAFDLRVLDNTGASVTHKSVKCDSCKEDRVKGLRWKCIECFDYDLCSECYMSDKHSSSHEFWRIDTPGSNRVKVPKRSGSTKVKVINKASSDVTSSVEAEDKYYYRDHLPVFVLPLFIVDDKVKINDDVEYVKLNQKGHGGWNEKMAQALGKIGRIYRIDSDNDLRVCVEDNRWAYNPACVTRIDGSELIEMPFAINDRVIIHHDEEYVKSKQKNHGGWSSRMAETLGKSGRVVKIDSDGDLKIAVDGNEWFFNPACATKIASPSFVIDEMVKIHHDVEYVKSKQKGHGLGWNDRMAEACGKIGRLIEVDSDGDLKVAIDGHLWFYNADCVTKIDTSELISLGNIGTASSNEINTESFAGLCIDESKSSEDISSFEAMVETIILSPSCSTSGAARLIGFLLEKRGNVNTQNNVGHTLLHCAVICDRVDMAEILLKNAADVNLVNAQCQSALHLAVQENRSVLVELLLEHHCDVDIHDFCGNTALHNAIVKGNMEIIDLLVAYSKTDLQLKCGSGFNALHLAAAVGNNLAVEKIIEKAAGIVDEKTDDGNTALHLAVIEGHFKVAKTLLEKGHCRIDVCNKDLRTPLLVAAKISNCAEVELLVLLNANIHAKDEDGNTALHLALQNQCTEKDITLTDAPAISRMFSDLKEVCDTVKNRGWLIACFLAQKGANLEEKNHLGKTPLDLVCSVDDQELLHNFAWKNRNAHLQNVVPKIDAKDTEGKSLEELQANYEQIRDLKNKLTEIEQANCCAICWEGQRDVVFLCGHGSCSSCAQSLQICHMCREPIQKKIKLY